MAQPVRVLLIDDEPMVGKRLVPALSRIGCQVEFHVDPVAALERLGVAAFDIVVTDIRMGPVGGLQVLARVMEEAPRTKVVIITGYAMMSLAREAMKKGAYDFLAKPFTPDELRAVVARAATELGLGDSLIEPADGPVVGQGSVT